MLGGTGSGKSTLTYLLDGLYPATRGGVYIGGRNVNDIPPATLRNNIGLMLQEGYIYSRTVGENIALAADGSQADIEQATTRCPRSTAKRTRVSAPTSKKTTGARPWS